MRRNDVVLAPPPPSLMAVDPQNTFPQQEPATTTGTRTTSAQPADGLNPSIIITVLVLATAIIASASIFLLIRFLSLYCRRHRRRSSTVEIVDAMASDSFRRYHHSHGSTAATSRVAPERSSIIDSLPLFTFASITGSSAANSGGDCAVCLSKFEPQDQLRLLPVCCHAFHAECIDAWLANNQTCPLCRSSIVLSESEVMSKILAEAAPNSASFRSGSFRVEIGNVSRRNLPSDSGSGNNNNNNNNNNGRSYSIGSFDYILDDDVISEVTVDASTRRIPDLAAGGDKSGESEIYVAPPGETLAAEVAAGGERWRGSWLKEYVDRMARTPSFSLSSSFRSSGRFFGGSSRRTEVSRALDSDLESASRLGDEIGEMFRWLSGV